MHAAAVPLRRSRGQRDLGLPEALEGRPDVDRERIGAVGMSMGGEEVIGAMAGDPRITAAAAEGATNRAYADKAWLSDEGRASI